MKKIAIITLLLFFNVFHAQTFDEKLEKLALEISLKLKKNNAKVVAVYPFFNIKKEETDLSTFISGEFDAHIKEDAIKTVDRSNMLQSLDELGLKSEGLIDPATAKKFGMFIAVDAYITGRVYMFGSVIRINLKAINPETGEIYASVIDKLPISYDLATFLNIENWKEKIEENKSENLNCAIENVGDYCFYNNTDDTYKITISGLSNQLTRREMILNPQSKSCFKDLKTQSYSYKIMERMNFSKTIGRYKEFKGEFRVKECESQLHKISAVNPISTNSSTRFFSVKINNPNYYSRKIEFINSQNQREIIIVAANSNSSIELPTGRYKYISKTTFSNTIIQRGNFNLNRNKLITLQKDHYN